ncbi:hypothetical protein CAEBREN_15933 [Caenorhabditis brenneri]|uniref:Mos1 transposase HTH domain-containing protein n=1 Tax=Caenorhabditis brenneri TaxID=135651 RepID=G0NGG7_CAEBE|nr:hypothetical protein CAEBREN_15933 [Caenorhabditis brenneri]
MAEVFETDEHAYRGCILYEVLHKNPLKEAYEKMKTLKPNIDYSDFEYWYFRFSNGRYDLKHDQSTDPSFADMPINVMESIVKNLGLVDNGRTYEPLATLLPHFKADLLRIWLDSPLDDTRENLLEVIGQTEQWKSATNIFIGDRVSNKFPIEVFFRARGRVDIDCKLSESRLIKIRDILFKIPTFTHFYFRDIKYDNREDLSVLTDRVMGANSAYDPQTKIYRIENSKDYIQISLPIDEGKSQGVQVLRIKRIHS